MSSKLTARQLGILLITLYFISGATGLAYEVLWIRMLSLQFGVSIFGVIVTVAAFMSGLGLGSLYAQNHLAALKNPIRLFGILEGLVACIALLMPMMFMRLEPALISSGIGNNLSAWYSIELTLIGLLLFVPAALLGAGFPIILRAVKKTPVSISHIYGVNAVGAALGALLPLILLPQLGWQDSMRVVALFGLGVAAVALFSCTVSVAQYSVDDIQKKEKVMLTLPLFLYAGIGAGALMLEVGWTRLFGMVMLRTEYVIAIILAVFLLGVGVGSVLAQYMKSKLWFSVLPVFSCAFVIISMWLVPLLSQWAGMVRYPDIWSNLLWEGCLLALVTFPVTLTLGAWFPLLTKRYGDDERVGAMLYGFNSIGSAVGAIAAGFLLTPAIGTSASVIIAGFMLLALGLVWAHSVKMWLVTPVLVLAAYPVMSMPSVGRLLPNLYMESKDLFYHEDALTITHVVERKDGQRLLLADLQRMDASSDSTAVETQKNQSRLPLLLHPEPKRILMLGLGTGISASATISFPGIVVDAVELSQGAILAARDWFKVVNADVMQHINIFRDDARHFLMTSQHEYDVIIGDLFHPDLIGRGALLSVQQFQRARQHLSDNGIFVQWLALNQFDVESLKIVLRSFKKVFPDAVLFVDGFRLALVGSTQIEGAPALFRNLERMSTQKQNTVTGGEGAWTWLGRYWGRVHVLDGKVQQEWAPVIEFRLPQTRASGELDLAKILNFLIRERPQVQQAAKELSVNNSDYDAFERAYIATDLAQRSWLALLTDKPSEGQRLLKLAYKANPKDRWIGFAVTDGALASYEANPGAVEERKLLTSLLRIRPDHADILKKLWQLELKAGNQVKANEYRQRLAEVSPLDIALRTEE